MMVMVVVVIKHLAAVLLVQLGVESEDGTGVVVWLLLLLVVAVVPVAQEIPLSILFRVREVKTSASLEYKTVTKCRQDAKNKCRKNYLKFA